jgi:uncharacterized membrane protein HdeD (DUF308 family)
MAASKIHTFQRLARGLLTLLTGFFLLLKPGLSVRTVLMLVGALLFTNGLMAFLISNKAIKIKRFFSLQGIFNMVAGLAFMFAPDAMLKMFIVFFGIILLMIGLVQLISALTSFSWRIWSLIYLLFALIMVSGGVILLYNPFKSLETIISFIGLLLIFYGTLQLMSFKVKKRPDYYNGSPVQDIPHEEIK